MLVVLVGHCAGAGSGAGTSIRLWRANGGAWGAHSETVRQSCVGSACGVGELDDGQAKEVRWWW